MKTTCTNHPEIEALNFCHSCGRHFCESCLVEGAEFFYCNNDKCQAAKNQDEYLYSEREEEKQRIEGVLTPGIGHAFRKNALLYLCTALPIYLAASCLIVWAIKGLQLRSLGVLSLMTLDVCVLTFIVTWIIARPLNKVADEKKTFRRNSIAMCCISSILFFLNIRKIDTDVAQNAAIVFSIGTSIITYAVSDVAFRILKRKTNNGMQGTGDRAASR